MSTFCRRNLFVLATLGLAGAAFAADPIAPAPTAVPSLKDAYRGAFLIGVAMNSAQFNGTDPKGAELILRQFNSITPENVLKWGSTEPADGKFDFDLADRFVRFGEENHMVIIGHTLCWNKQLPAWVSRPPEGQSELTKAVLLERLRRHIQTVVGRYKGRVHGWDVVNEAIGDHSGNYRDSVFYRVIGQEYLPLAFKWAHEADPQAELYYNDFNLDQDDAKRAGAVELIKYLRAQGAPIDGIGLQGHYNLTFPHADKIDETIQLFAKMGLKVMITELDVEAVRNAEITGAVGARAFGWGRAKPLTPEQQQQLAQRYGDIFAVLWKNRASVTRVTLWGLRDADSWRRYASPLLFDAKYQPKPAYFAVIKAPTK